MDRAWHNDSMTFVRPDDLGNEGFANGALYDRARPDYPVTALNYFAEALGLHPRMSVVDLGAGTGIFSRQVRPYVGHVIAVEPSASMRDALRAQSPDIEVRDGSDVDIPLASASVDAVFVAQAFHWFDAPRALREIHRVLTRAGGLGLIWNERDESVAWVHELSKAMQWDTRQPYEVGRDFRSVIAQGPFVDVDRAVFRQTQTLTHDGVYERVLSTSYISVMDERSRDRLMEQVRRVVSTLEEPLELPYVTSVYSARAEVEPTVALG